MRKYFCLTNFTGEIMSYINIKNTTMIYKSGLIHNKILDNVSMSIEKGELVSIVGTSGSGKSTLLNILGGLLSPVTGVVEIDGIDISKMKGDDLTLFRRDNIGFIFQEFNLINELDVENNIKFPLMLRGDNSSELYKILIEKLGLTEKEKSMPNQLSGGQQQRVAIARALIMKPSLVLADEPTGSLDSENSRQILEFIKILSKELEQTVIIVTHDMNIAKECDRIIKVKDGYLYE